MITVTIVRIAADLGFAKVYVSVFPAEDPKLVVDGLNDAMPEINRALYPRIKNQFRKMPELRFYLDDSLDYAERINEILPD